MIGTGLLVFERQVAGLVLAALVVGGIAADAQSEARTAVDYAGVVGRSDVVLERGNPEPNQAMPLGNGRLGVVIWSAEGVTAQLNRGDTLPEMLPVARLTLPGLATLTTAPDYSGRLSLYDGEFRESGAGLRAVAYVDAASDSLVIEVQGAQAGAVQTARLTVPLPQSPKAEANGPVGVLSRTWLDDQEPGASGRSFGALAAITAEGRAVTAKVLDAQTVAVSFRPFADGHFRVIVAAPHFDHSSGSAEAVARDGLRAAAGDARGRTEREWHGFWQRTGYMKVTSADGAGEYMENLRALYLYSAAAESGGEYPGSQAGVADLLSSAPRHHWAPA
jgi:hypothetical protein